METNPPKYKTGQTVVFTCNTFGNKYYVKVFKIKKTEIKSHSISWYTYTLVDSDGVGFNCNEYELRPLTSMEAAIYGD